MHISTRLDCLSSGSSVTKARVQPSPLRPTCASRSAVCVLAASKEVTLLDYGAGNVRSVRNAIKKLGYTIKDVEKPSDIMKADRLIFPGVGAFGQAMRILEQNGWTDPLKEYIQEGKPFLGICLGLQLLFEGSEESGGHEGLGIIPGMVAKFDTSLGLPVPHIGWNDLQQTRPSTLLGAVGDQRVYFVHSYRATPIEANKDWVLSTTSYGEPFVSSISKGQVSAVQFHPEKSGVTGLSLLQAFLDPSGAASPAAQSTKKVATSTGLAKRVIACLDVRSNDNGDLVVTKGDQYDVREKSGERDVRNLGKPVELCARYFQEGADEVTFLNITGFRDCPLSDMPMLEVLRQASERVFVPLTVGGGIKALNVDGKSYSALEVASEYFRSGADKISIGSDAVEVAEKFVASGVADGTSSIEQISAVYGRQAVVVSVDPRRVYVADPSQVKHHTVKTSKPGPNGEQYCWWQCTIKGGREGRDIGAVELAKAVEALGAGEILLNCIDNDGVGKVGVRQYTGVYRAYVAWHVAVEALGAGEILLNCIDNDGVGKGFDLELVGAVSSAVTIPVIASSGAGVPQHFSEVFAATKASAALAAGIFHRREVGIDAVKEHMVEAGIPTRL